MQNMHDALFYQSIHMCLFCHPVAMHGNLRFDSVLSSTADREMWTLDEPVIQYSRAPLSRREGQEFSGEFSPFGRIRETVRRPLDKAVGLFETA